MTVKPTYEELERRIQELEKIESGHKYYKEALNENLYKMLYEKAPLGYQSLDEKGHFIVVNQTWIDTLGYTKEEVIGKSFADFLHPDWCDHFKENFPRFKSIGEVLGVEFEMVKKDGNIILVSFTGKISRDKKGDFQQTHCIFHDITDRKRMEEALLESEEKYRILFEHTGEALFVVQDGRIVFHNPKSTELSGYFAEELHSKPFVNFIHKEDRKIVADHHIRRLRGEKTPEGYFFRVIHKSGRILWAELNAVVIQWKEKPAVLCFMTDITERKHINEDLQKERAVFKAIIDNIPVMITRYDPDINILYLNKEIERKLGWKTEELRDINLMEELYPDPAYRKNVQEYMEKGVCEWREFSIRAKSGKIVISEWSNIRLYEGTQIGIGIDVTNRKQAEENLRRMNEELEQKVAERTQVAKDRANKLHTLVGELTLAEQKERQRIAKILHDDLQQLLVGARFNSEILCGNIGERHKKIARNVFDLINQSIQTSRSLTTELYPSVLQQGLSASLQWTVRWMNENHGLTIDLQTDPDIDPKQEDVTAFLYQSTRELLLNVIKHSGVKSARLEMTCDEGQKQLRVTVSDNGSGFDSGAVLKNEGTGFGLFSIYERLQLMGGSIQIESSPGNGASLSLIVPLEKKEEKEDEVIREIKTEDKITKTDEDKIRTLVVDDHTVVRQGISTLLSLHSDIEMVGEAGDGREAVEKARQLHPDVILMDISMPRMDGIQATRIIRSELPYVRIVGFSMHDKQDQADQIIRAGASAYCTKDGSTDELLSAIRRSD